MKTPVFVLTEKTDIGNPEWSCRMGGEPAVRRILDRACILVQRPGQGEVEAEFIHHIGVAVSVKQRALPYGQAFGAAACGLGFGKRRAKAFEAIDDACGKHTDGGKRIFRDEREEPADAANREAAGGCRGNCRSMSAKGLAQSVGVSPRRQPEGRFQRPVKTVSAGFRRQIGKARNAEVGLLDHGPGQSVAAEPACSGVRERAFGRSEVDRVTFHPHPAAVARLCHRHVTFACDRAA